MSAFVQAEHNPPKPGYYWTFFVISRDQYRQVWQRWDGEKWQEKPTMYYSKEAGK